MLTMSFLNLKKRQEELFQGYVELSRNAESHRKQEHEATIIIQCAWRRKLVNLKVKRWHKAAREIQRRYRGHVGRAKAWIRQMEREKEQRITLFNHSAATIQKYFRGYEGRKYIHDFYGRKRFIADSLKQGLAIKNDLNMHTISIKKEEHQTSSCIVQEEIHKFWLANHHFVSTKSRNGIFYSPYIAVLKGSNDIEDRIRAARRAYLSKKREEVGGYHRLLGPGSRPKKLNPVKLSNFITTVGTPYNTALAKRMAEEKQKSLKNLTEKGFVTVVRPLQLGVGPTIRMQTEWQRHFKMRKIEQRQQAKGFLKVAEKPFSFVRPPTRRFSCGPL